MKLIENTMKLGVTQSPGSPHWVPSEEDILWSQRYRRRVSPGLPSREEQRYDPAQNIATTTKNLKQYLHCFLREIRQFLLFSH